MIEKAADVAAGYVEKKEDVVNLLKQQEGVASNQVMLRVRFAEVSRSAMKELGVNLFIAERLQERLDRPHDDRSSSPRRTSTTASRAADVQRLPEPVPVQPKDNLGARHQGAAEQGTLPEPGRAEPDRENGKEASFLAGGEYPYPVVQRAAAATPITIMFKEFGVRLHFTPTVVGGDLINLKVRPEVSSLDFANAHRARRLPHPGADDAPHRDRSRAAGRPDVRDRRADEQHAEQHAAEDPGHRRHPDPRLPVQEQGVPEEPDRARRDDHADDPAPRIDGRVGRACPRWSSRSCGAPEKTLPPPAPYVGSPRYPADRAGARRAAQPPAPARSSRAVPAPQPSPAPVEPRPIQAASARAAAPAPMLAPAAASKPSRADQAAAEAAAGAEAAADEGRAEGAAESSDEAGRSGRGAEGAKTGDAEAAEGRCRRRRQEDKRAADKLDEGARGARGRSREEERRGREEEG